MGDLGSLFGGGGSPNMSDASLGDAIMGGSGTFGDTSGGGGFDPSSVNQFTQAMTALSGGGGTGGGVFTDPATTQAITTSPTIGGADSTPAAGGGTQSGTAPGDTPANQQPAQGQAKQPSPQNIVEQIRKALTERAQRLQANPYVPGGGQPPAMQAAASIPTEGTKFTPPPQSPGGEGASYQPEYGPGQDAPAPYPEGAHYQPEYGHDPQGGGPPDQPDIGTARNPAAAGQGAVAGATAPPEAPAVTPPAPGEGIQGLPAPGDPSTLVPPGLPGLGRGAGLGALAAALNPTPAQTGELPYGYGGAPNQPARPVTPTPGQVKTDAQGNPITAAGTPASQTPSPPSRPDTTTAPATGKPIETVDPKTKKPVDSKTGAPLLPTKKGDEKLPTKTGPLPTHKGGPAAPTPGTMLADVTGHTGANPQTLMQLASLAMPLIAMAMGGGGRHGGFRGRGGGFGRFGGFRGGQRAMGGGHGPLPGFRGGNLPAGHYPNRQGGFHFHPGGWHDGWDAHPNWGGQPQQSGVNPAVLAALTGGQQQPGGQGGQSGQGGQGGGANPFQPGGGGAGQPGGGVTAAPVNGPWSDNPFLTTLVGAESQGREGPNVRGDGGQAKGFFQFHDATWQQYARNVPGASQYASAEGAPAEMQQAVAMTAPISLWGQRTRDALHAKFGAFDERMTIGDLAKQFGGQGGGTTRTAATPAPRPPIVPSQQNDAGPIA